MEKFRAHKKEKSIEESAAAHSNLEPALFCSKRLNLTWLFGRTEEQNEQASGLLKLSRHYNINQ